MKATVTVQVVDTSNGIKPAIEKVFSQISKETTILKSSKEVYLKINGVHFTRHCYVDTEVLKATIEHMNAIGAEKVYVMEDSTIGNVTRLVFDLIGYKKVCKETGAKPVYLDEDKAQSVILKSGKSVKVPKTISRIAEHMDTVTYIDLAKLKSHNATVVTLGMKNQYGFLSHADRKVNHDENIHSVIADLYEYIKPDLTIIDGTEAVSGEMPVLAFEDRLIRKLDVLIGGTDTVAVDVVGARILGYQIDQVPHLKIAQERGLGETNLDVITVLGRSLDSFDGKSDWNIVDQFPKDVKVFRGSQKLCREGCEINTLIAVQTLVYDYGGKGDFFVAIGKGFEDSLITQLKNAGFSRGLIAGHCAVEELENKLVNEFGRKNVYVSDSCCNIAETVNSLVKLTKLSTFDLIPISRIRALGLFMLAKIHGSRALLAI